jgi:16S rRNA (guanine527-N7)-methyltransferase
MAITCTPAQQAQLLDYVALLAKWNQVYNLTAGRDPLEMVGRHLLDSLSVLPYLEGRRVLDVGTGAGLPGIPLAVLCPEREFVLLDSNGKKTRFVQQAVAELGLRNVTVVHSRAEDFRADPGFDVVVSRAFAAIADMLTAAGGLCAPGGVILAMKGAHPAAELAALPPGYTLAGVHRLSVPDVHEERHLVCVRRALTDSR